jgi:hypothetical protein
LKKEQQKSQTKVLFLLKKEQQKQTSKKVTKILQTKDEKTYVQDVMYKL